MSDRVAVIGGKTSGRDHFPVFNNPPNVFGQVSDLGATPYGNGTAYPFSVTLARMCKWYYLVKKWNLRIDYTYHDIFGASFTNYAS